MKLLKLVPDNTNIDFMRWRNLALVLSILVTVASLAIVGIRGLNLGIDFVGGQMVRATFAQPIEVDQLRDRVNALGLGDASIQESGSATTYQIRLPKAPGPEGATNKAVSRVREMIPREYPGARVDAGESVSGKVSEELALDLVEQLGRILVAALVEAGLGQRVEGVDIASDIFGVRGGFLAGAGPDGEDDGAGEEGRGAAVQCGHGNLNSWAPGTGQAR